VSSSYYDVIVLGTELSALTCAALLAKRGFRVLVLGQQTDLPDYALGPYRLPRQPFAFTAAHSPLARRILSELGLGQSFRRRAHALEPAFQLALPGHRFEIGAEEAELEREVEREFPEVRRPILDFFRRIRARSDATDQLFERDMTWPPDSLLERRELGRLAARLDLASESAAEKLLGEFPESHAFRIAVRALVSFGAHADAAATTELQLTRLFNGRTRGPQRFDGGLAGLTDLLADKIRAHSGELRLHERAQQIMIKRAAVSGVRLFGSDEELGCATVIAGVDVAALQRLLADRSPFEEMFERLGEPQPRYYRYTLNALVAAAAVPEGMRRDVFYIRDPERPLHSENLLHVERSDVDASTRLLCMEALLPAPTVEQRHGYLDEARERMMQALAELVPFIGEHLVALDSPHDGRKPWARDSDVNVTVDPRERRGPHTMAAVHAYPVSTALGVCAMSVKTPLRGLLLCSQQVAPGLGVEGQLLAAASAAHVVRRSDRSREWLRRRLWTKVEM
jgi:phytoene dehydrogenase-like protein